MAAFIKSGLTEAGQLLLAKAITGKTIKFTRISIGDGELPPGTEIQTLNNLIGRIMDIEITSFKVNDDRTATVSGAFTNSQLNEGFYYREIGLFAEDPENGEILYCYGNAGEYAEWIAPTGSQTIIEKIVNIVTYIGAAENISISVKSETYITAQDMEEAIESLSQAFTQKIGIEKSVWLSDLNWESVSAGTAHKDTDASGSNPIELLDNNGEQFTCPKGVSVFAPANTTVDITYSINAGEYDAFEAYVGINATGNPTGEATFRLYYKVGDGSPQYLYVSLRTVQFTAETPAKYIHVDIPADATSLIIEASSGKQAWANFGEARLIKYADSDSCDVSKQITAGLRTKADMQAVQAEIQALADDMTAEFENVNTDLDSKADKENPELTGIVSHQRKANSDKGKFSVVFGYDNKASGQYGIGLGANNDVSGQGAVAAGILNKASGQGSVAVGMQNQSTRPGACSEGANNIASGDASHAENVYNVASGAYSHAQGMKTIAAGQAQDVDGRYNVPDTENKYAHITGNGTSEENRSNAYTLDWKGNAEFAGDVVANACGGEKPISLIALSELYNSLQSLINELWTDINDTTLGKPLDRGRGYWQVYNDGDKLKAGLQKTNPGPNEAYFLPLARLYSSRDGCFNFSKIKIRATGSSPQVIIGKGETNDIEVLKTYVGDEIIINSCDLQAFDYENSIYYSIFINGGYESVGNESYAIPPIISIL